MCIFMLCCVYLCCVVCRFGTVVLTIYFGDHLISGMPFVPVAVSAVSPLMVLVNILHRSCIQKDASGSTRMLRYCIGIRLF